MSQPTETCWSLVRRAAGGDARASSLFARSYLEIVRAFFARRWAGTLAANQCDDAVQEVFLDLFRSNGALSRVDPDREGNFRSFLFGVAHKVALRHEERAGRNRDKRQSVDADAMEAPDPTMSQAFDRAWAERMVRAAAERQLRLADGNDDAARRVELLQLRFGDGLPIREIAARWGIDAALVHREYAKARQEFKQALRAEVGFHMTGPAEALDRECRNLISLLE